MTDLHHDIFCRRLFSRLQDEREILRTSDESLNAFTDLQEMLDHYSCLMDECESPIERMLGAALLFTTDGYHQIRYVMSSPDDLASYAQHVAKERPSSVFTFFAAQNTVGAYRVDFLLATVCEGSIAYSVIECDGHDFHERTKEQASRDKKRDRAFVALGIPVLRFTGSDIHRNLDGCKGEIESHLFRLMEGMLRAKGRVAL